MNLFKKYYKIIIESTAEDRYRKRKGLSPLKTVSTYELLEKYKDDENVYISFRNSQRININPLTKHKNTPSGIYANPLKIVWNSDFFDHKNKNFYFPFAGDRNYIYVIKPKNINNVLNLQKYDLNNFKKDIEKLKNSKIFDVKKIDFLVKNAKNKSTVNTMFNLKNNIINTYGAYIWYTMFFLLKKEKTFLNKVKDFFSDSEKEELTKHNLWNKVLNNVLGYDYVLDEGDGIIHYVEKAQAVFLKNSSFNVLDIIDNKKNYGKVNVNNIWNRGTYIDENWENGLWKDGIWKGKTWIYGIWVKGIWKSGTWKDGLWKDGTLEDGFFNGGIWKKGTWKKGTWSNATWKDGTWEDGVWENGTWEKGIWEKGIWEGGTWQGGTWKTGTWKNGTWEGGFWEGGTWHDGLWKGGTWLGGTWLGGHDKNLKYHKRGDSPDKWDLK